MSFLDEVFKNPQPNRVVRFGLYKLYMYEMVARGQQEGWDEGRLADAIQSLKGYLAYLSELNDIVVQEISDVSDQVYGEQDLFGENIDKDKP